MSKSTAAADLARKRWAGISKSQRSKIMRPIGKLGGRPKVIRACGKCGATGGTAEMRGHKCAADAE